MDETIITKRCSKCKQIRPLSNFHRDKSKKDGHCFSCNICACKRRKKYRNSEKGKTIIKVWEKSESGKALRRHYQKTEQYKAYQSRYRNSDFGKASIRASVKKYSKRFPLHIKAKGAVYYAVKIGKLPKVKTLQCYLCFKSAQQYHHYLGHEPQYKLDVLPMCIMCHRKLHRLGFPLALSS